MAQSSVMSLPAPGDSNSFSSLCGTDNLLNLSRKDKQYKAKEAKMNREILSVGRLADNPIVLPVVFHIISANPFSTTDQQIVNALKDLNDGFSKAGMYAASKGADTKISFCLAQQDPDGGNTTGITRTTSFFADNQNPAIEDDKLKNLVQWDPAHYINIWLISSMNQEEYAFFNCGQWTRLYKTAYATMPPGGTLGDGIVVTQFGYMLIHEMGHYLGLYHTFEGLNCSNSDCTKDGDMVCDTPPEVLLSTSSCSLRNSCSSDTLSGFSSDVPDLVEDFMGYGNAACANEFTDGQAQRMRAAIITQRSGLLQNKCTKPCDENIIASFVRNNANPVPGDVIRFTNTSSGATNYQWLVNNAVVSTSADFSYSFIASGKYQVTLKAYNNNISCYANYTDNVIVNCGVTARFFSDKEFLASKIPLYADSAFFKNTSVNATAFTWLISNDQGMQQQVVGTAKDLTYLFPAPANYSIQLIASNGSCTDTTETNIIQVQDPTPDGVIKLLGVSCYQKTKIKILFFICNNGYATMPSHAPVSFYDADPRLSNANKIGTSFIVPDNIPGHCCSQFYTYIIDVDRPGLNQLHAVFNDAGNTMPLQLPNTSLIESNYSNNIDFLTAFQFKVSITPPTAVLVPGDVLQLIASATPDSALSYNWSSPHNLSCTACDTTFLIADSATTKQIIAVSKYGCEDTAYIDIKIPPYNDYTININDAQCSAGDSLHINFTVSNSFRSGIIPKGLMVTFYNGDPASGNATLLKPVFRVPNNVDQKQFTYNTVVSGMSAGNLYTVVNDNGSTTPLQLPNDNNLPEKDYTNNTYTVAYKPEAVNIQPSDTTVFRKQQVPLTINSTIFDPSSTAWFSGNGYVLSCPGCNDPVATVYNNSTVQMQTANKYGCLIKGEANINIFPPDMIVNILKTGCYSNTSTLVTFQICMNNNYDSIFANVPVTFYDANPFKNAGHLLYPVFYTPSLMPGQCYTFTHTVFTPASNQLFAIVNDKGDNTAVIPDKAYDETDYENDTSHIVIQPFQVYVNPSDTTVSRSSIVNLSSYASGGNITSYLWDPFESLSCYNCAAPVATPAYTTKYVLLVKNEHLCTDTASVTIKTISDGTVNIPNAFTPNSDGLNDVFYIISGANVSLVTTFSVFNRWGQKVFQVSNVAPNDPAYGWKGFVNGVQAPAGAYVYTVNIAFADGTQKLYKGTVVLIR